MTISGSSRLNKLTDPKLKIIISIWGILVTSNLVEFPAHENVRCRKSIELTRLTKLELEKSKEKHQLSR